MSKTTDYLPIMDLFQKYIQETSKGRRLQKNGKLVSKSTIKNYQALRMNLVKFFEKDNTIFYVNINYRYSKRNFEFEKRNYRVFYRKFTDYLFLKGCTDNYVGLLVKTFKSFFIYLNQFKGYRTGDFFRDFYARREEIPVLVLDQSKLQFLIGDSAFENGLPVHLRVCKDIFVVGCSIGLRFSDLMALKVKNFEKLDNRYYIVKQSIKTNTISRIKIPDYVHKILLKYKGKQSTLLPKISLNQFNKNLKRFAEIAEWTDVVGKERSKRGIRKELKMKNGKAYRFCDLISSHTMRRTAITTMLILGMPEPLVRKVSGHAANSQEFYKYVKYTDSFVDAETDKVFDKLLQRI